ncbi:MAG: hypothetical protein HFJ35_02985 [Clostridia bacterium]|nr:hypothetical protein [Clostridia bacterium]
MNYFPNGDNEIKLIRFIAKFQYLSMADSKYFFPSSKYYYRNRVNNLIAKKFIKKIKSNLMLDEIGIEYCQLFHFEYTRRNRNKKYLPRLLQISNIGAFYNNCEFVKYTPSFSMKDKEQFTVTARRFIGILEINGFEYLTYQITNEQDSKYAMTVIYDIQKEKYHKNIIILIDDSSKININDFAFGLNQVLIVTDTEDNREKLKYLNSVNWSKILDKYYRNKVVLSEYIFCDYTDYKKTYVSCFYFLDSEKINRIKQFLRENRNKSIDIICDSQLEKELKKELPTARYITVNLEEYIDKERNYYD